MKGDAGLEAYADALGGAELRAREIELDGVRFEHSVEPCSGEELARAVGALSSCGLSALVRGRGSLDHFGNAPVEADLVLSLASLTGIHELQAEEGVVRVAAGTRIEELRTEAEKQGWTLALDPPGDASVGGALAASSIGPHHLGNGAPRDSVLGLDVVLATGERTRCGGRVVKNVTGYDLAKLYTGSFGSLGVIEAAWLRLRPLPEHRAVLALALAPDADAAEIALQTARRGSVCCAALLSPAVALTLGEVGSGVSEPDGWLLLASLAGAAAEVERDCAAIGERAPAREVALEAIDALREQQGSMGGAGGLRARLAIQPSAVAEVVARLRAAGAQLIAHPGTGVVYAAWEGETVDVEAMLRVVDEVSREARAHTVLEALSAVHKRDRDVFGDPGETLGLMRALKRSFDPEGRLNRGRFAGRL